MRFYKYIIQFSLLLTSIYATTAHAEWKNISVKGSDGKNYTLHESPDKKSVWTDALDGKFFNYNPKNNVAPNGILQDTPATNACDSFGRLINFEKSYSGKKMILPTVKDYIDHFIIHFDHYQKEQFKSEPVTKGIRITDMKQVLNDKDSGKPLFNDMDGKQFWTSSLLPECSGGKGTKPCGVYGFSGGGGGNGVGGNISFYDQNVRKSVRCVGR